MTTTAAAVDRQARTLRAVLAVLAVAAAVTGAYAAAWPTSFFDTMLGVDSLPPYNEHLVRDVGGLYLGFGLVFWWAARSLHRDLVGAASSAWIVVQAIHLAYHAAHITELDGVTAVVQTVGQIAFIALPVAALGLSRRSATP